MNGRQMNLHYLRSIPGEDEQALKHAVGRNKEGISLFSGCGGFDLGFHHAGLTTKVMVEWNKDACATLRANFTKEGLKDRFPNPNDCPGYSGQDPVILERDITTLPTEEILRAGGFEVGEPFFVIGGPPCQGFSTAGQRMIDDPRNKLYKEFVRVVGEALPMTFIFENVKGLVSMVKGAIIKQICEDFAKCGYDVAWDVLDAADYGVPQHRKRVFLFGKRNDVMVFKEDERVEVHLGGVPGPITHPEFFLKKYGKGLGVCQTKN